MDSPFNNNPSSMSMTILKNKGGQSQGSNHVYYNKHSKSFDQTYQIEMSLI